MQQYMINGGNKPSNDLLHCLSDIWQFGRQISVFPRNLLPSSSWQQGRPHEGKTLVGFILSMKDWDRNEERKTGADLKVYESKENRNAMKWKGYNMGKK